MNSSPIAFRLTSGSTTPASRARNRSAAFTCTSGTWKCRANVSSTWSGSPSLFRPWSTNTHVSWSPIARCTSSAATAESTPPLSAHSTWASPTCDRMRATWSSMMFVGRPVGKQVAPVVEESLHHVLAARRVRDLGVELHRVQAPRGVLHRRDGDLVGRRGHPEPLGRAGHRVTVRHPDGVGRRQVLEQRSSPALAERHRRAPVLPLAGRRHLAAERARHQLVAVADAEHGNAEVEQPGIDLRRSLGVDATPVPRSGSARPAATLATSARPRRRAARSRSRRAPRARAARSAARTAPRGRRPGPGAARPARG